MARNRNGVTLVEVLIVVVILSATLFLTRLAIQFLNVLARQKNLTELQRSSQLVVFNLTREIRNAKEIVEVDHDTLVLSAFSAKQFGYNSPTTFQTVNVGTITYQYRFEDGVSFLERTSEFPVDGGVVRTQKLLKHMVVAPTETDYMFKGGPGMAPPYDSVEIKFQLKPMRGQDDVVAYNEVAVKRAARH